MNIKPLSLKEHASQICGSRMRSQEKKGKRNDNADLNCYHCPECNRVWKYGEYKYDEPDYLYIPKRGKEEKICEHCKEEK